jgi:hypothetical protein
MRRYGPRALVADSDRPRALELPCTHITAAVRAPVLARFSARFLPSVPGRHAADPAPVQASFAGLCVVGGSRPAAIAYHLTLLWPERAVVLPECLLAVYDLGRWLCRTLISDADVPAGELMRAQPMLATLPRTTLVLGHRLYSTVVWFAALSAGLLGCCIRRE